MAGAPRVFTIAPGAGFLETFARALIEGRIVPGLDCAGDPLALAQTTIYAPTRRSARALASVIAQALPTDAAILPRIMPLGAMEGIETRLLFDEPGMEGAALDIPLAVPEIERRLILTRLILAWSRRLPGAILTVNAAGEAQTHPDEALLVATSAPPAFALAGELASLLDELIIEAVPFSALQPLARDAGEDRFDLYWGITLDFLKIIADQWPAWLKERGLLDAADRQARLVAAEAVRLDRGDNDAPTIVIGSTGTNRATADLIAAVARAPRGAVVLPGLDQSLDDDGWRLVAGDGEHEAATTHPQAALHRLLPILGVRRVDVQPLGEADAALRDRARFLSEAMRPADTTDHWRDFPKTVAADAISAAFADVTIIEAEDERAEALALAIAIRKALEDPRKTVALATPDRGLAQRVRAELARWRIEVDDSGGESLAASPIGALASLALRCAAKETAAADLPALLAHPMACFGCARGGIDALRRKLEAGVLRQPSQTDGDLAARIAAARAQAQESHPHPAQAALTESDWNALADFAAKITAALAPLRDLAPSPLAAWLDAHRRVLDAIAQSAADRDAADADAREALESLFVETGAAASVLGETLDHESYAGLFDALAREAALRGPRRAHPRVKILGLLEARLLDADVMLLAGLDETIWPPSASSGPFLNRPMRAALNLPPPERRIGQTAHDFTQAMGAREVVISRARKIDGAPTVPSRFLQRMRALASEELWRACLSRGQRLIELADAIDRPAAPITIGPPKPKPPLELRPTRLSLTRIEILRRDPYALYAERILKLAPLEGFDADMRARDVGSLLHQVLKEVADAHPAGPLPGDGKTLFIVAARDKLARLLEDAEFRTFRWPLIEASLASYADWEGQRRGGLASALSEESGDLAITLADGSGFKLSAIADRIETRHDGTLAIFDFKTGLPPSPREIEVGFAIQLTLAMAMAKRGAFKRAAQDRVFSDAAYVRLLGRDGVTRRDVPGDLATLSEEHFDGAVRLLDQFRKEDTPYLSRPYVKFVHRYSAYDHLARVKEWSAQSDAGGGA